MLFTLRELEILGYATEFLADGMEEYNESKPPQLYDTEEVRELGAKLKQFYN